MGCVGWAQGPTTGERRSCWVGALRSFDARKMIFHARARRAQRGRAQHFSAFRFFMPLCAVPCALRFGSLPPSFGPSSRTPAITCPPPRRRRISLPPPAVHFRHLACRRGNAVDGFPSPPSVHSSSLPSAFLKTMRKGGIEEEAKGEAVNQDEEPCSRLYTWTDSAGIQTMRTISNTT